MTHGGWIEQKKAFRKNLLVLLSKMSWNLLFIPTAFGRKLWEESFCSTVGSLEKQSINFCFRSNVCCDTVHKLQLPPAPGSSSGTESNARVLNSVSLISPCTLLLCTKPHPRSAKMLVMKMLLWNLCSGRGCVWFRAEKWIQISPWLGSVLG